MPKGIDTNNFQQKVRGSCKGWEWHAVWILEMFFFAFKGKPKSWTAPPKNDRTCVFFSGFVVNVFEVVVLNSV